MDPALFDTTEHKIMTDILLDNVMESGLTAKALTMEEVVNANTPSSLSDKNKPIQVNFLVLGDQSQIRNSLSLMKSMMSKGALHRRMIIHDERWYDVEIMELD